MRKMPLNFVILPKVYYLVFNSKYLISYPASSELESSLSSKKFKNYNFLMASLIVSENFILSTGFIDNLKNSYN